MNQLADLGIYSLIVAGILVMTRPGSQGPRLVAAGGSAWAHVVQAASGQRISG